MLPLVSAAVEQVFHPEHPFYVGSAMDLLFDGFPIDCSTQEFQGKAFCTQIESEIKGIRRLNETHFLLSIFQGVSDQLFVEFRYLISFIIIEEKSFKWW